MPHTVLLVDDEPNVLAGLKRALRKEAYLILCASSAEEALGILRTQAVDAIVTDQDMPGMLGTTFLAIVHEEFPDTVRFMLTGKATLDVAIEAINAGAISRFFTKPYDNIDFAVTLRQALQHKDLITEAKRLLHTVKRQSSELERMEHQYPGITRVQCDSSGAIISTPDISVEELLQQLNHEAARAEQLLSDSDT